MQRYESSICMYIPHFQLFYFCNSALSLVSDKKKLVKEVTTMLSFMHPNVMSIIGACFDEEVPLIIMPFMTHGSVLGHVKQNKQDLLFDSQANQDDVCNIL